MMKMNLSGTDYQVMINSIEFNSVPYSLEEFLELIFQIQNKFPGSLIQFFNDKFVLNEEQVLNACYFMVRAFNSSHNISSNRNLEFLLYLACSRQIKYSLKHFGLNDELFKKGVLNYCIISSKGKIIEINNEIRDVFNCVPQKPDILRKSLEKFDNVKNFFNFSKSQLEVILNSYEAKIDFSHLENDDLDIIYRALSDLICEKMVLLSLEKVKVS